MEAGRLLGGNCSIGTGQPGSFTWLSRTVEQGHWIQGHSSWCLVSGVPTSDLNSTGQGSYRVMPGMPLSHSLPCPEAGIPKPCVWASK